MKWQGRRQSDNVEDRRTMSTTGKVAAGGGAIGIIFLLIQLFLGGDSGEITAALVNEIAQPSATQSSSTPLTKDEEVVGQFVSTVLADTEDVWHDLFAKNNINYKEPKLVLFKNATQSGCGGADARTGPFYCPSDQTIYMDLIFFNELKDRFGAKGGDFAIAYVLAHEVGHHVQNQLGLLNQVQDMRQQLTETQNNRVNVAMELQADYYAGVWSHYQEKYLSEGDLEEAINAAAAVGDDNIQKSTQGYVRPESFTHGTSQQRIEWFKKGYRAGTLADGDTFKALLK